jgi:hypothetical protein
LAHICLPRNRPNADRKLLSVCNKEKIERILAYMLDENEFFGPYGIRSVSRYHLDHPFVFNLGGQNSTVQYLPAESNTGMFGRNSNWQGPVWMPVNGLLIRGLLNLYQFYGNDFKVECPTGSGKYMTLFEVAKELARRLSSIFLSDANGKRPVYGGMKKFQEDPHWKDYILFHEYFHADNGAGLGASHQTGWSGIIGDALRPLRRLSLEPHASLNAVIVVIGKLDDRHRRRSKHFDELRKEYGLRRVHPNQCL